jgi:hypothetical protein
MSPVLAVHVADHLTHKASANADPSRTELDERVLSELGVADHMDEWTGLAADLEGTPASAR